jgi:uncharacterized membrane protein
MKFLNINLIDKNLIFKTLLYRLLAAFGIFFISYFFTKKIIVSGFIGGTEFLLKTVLYYLYELFWKKFIKLFKKEK